MREGTLVGLVPWGLTKGSPGQAAAPSPALVQPSLSLTTKAEMRDRPVLEDPEREWAPTLTPHHLQGRAAHRGPKRPEG